ncbi:MAG TPA: uracil-DNA glycosylase [Longimicrobiaceae bacterium]|nr:uracil-DNA glycosylase [Longimicrobiaceae bacterium]
MGDARELLERYLRQRAELGDAELVLERHTPAQVRDAISARAASGPARSLTDALRPPAEPSPATQATSTAAAPDPRPSAPGPRSPSRSLERVAVSAPGGEGEAGAMRASPAAPATGATAEEILALPVLDAVREVALGCPRCGLANTRRHVVFGEGDPTASVMVVGEAPGAEEDRTGRPFVGKAGKLLDLLLASVGLPRDAVYICNVLKCRPPDNRNPMADEVEACSPYLIRQVDLVRPRAILAFGNFAAHTLLKRDDPMSRLRGRVHDYRGIPLIPTYHPAALLRNPGWVRAVWDDLQLLRSTLDPA